MPSHETHPQMPGRQMAVATRSGATETPSVITALFIGCVFQSTIRNHQSRISFYTHLHSLRIKMPVIPCAASRASAKAA
jgi:hypothetical protein